MTQQSFSSTLAILGLLISFTACQKDPVESPLEPQQQYPNPLPTEALISRQQYSETDYQTFIYNANGQVTEHRSQWQFVEGDPTQIKSITYAYSYDDKNRLTAVRSSDGGVVKYLYKGEFISKSQEFASDGALSKEVTYGYTNNRITQELWRVANIPGEPADVYKFVLGYDGVGNLNKVESFQQEANGQYKLLETVEYSNFDDKINPTSWMLRHPNLPQVRWQFNNPGMEIRRPAGENDLVTTYTYDYNAKDMPFRKHITTPDGQKRTVTYRF